jgi:pimeloyl-ACP methyl ester carboxylesterase
MALALVLLVAYLAFVGYQGSQVFGAQPRAGDCATPASAFGWSYEAINYDIASDRDLDGFSDRGDCPHQGQAAGATLTASDGTRIAGWFVPAANKPGPTAPTVVLAHADEGNKSDMLAWAEPLHATYNLVFFDFRNHGQSAGNTTTLGVREATDVKAVVDWLAATKRPSAIALLGVAMGGAAAIDEAAADDRVDAVILDSTHATLANAIEARLEHDGYPLAVPGAWSVLLGGLLRTGEDMTVADPVQAIDRYGARPVLIVAAGNDDAIGPNDPAELVAAARQGGATAELETCPGAAHTQSVTKCSKEYSGWVLGFLERSLHTSH